MLHHGVGTEEKLATLTDSEFRAHIAGVLAIASTSPLRGYLFVGELEATPLHIATKAKVTQRVAKSAFLKMCQVGVLVRDDEVGGWRVHNWESFQPQRSDPTAARRAQEYRARRKSALANHVTERPTSRDASRDDHVADRDASRSSSRAPGPPEGGVEVEVGSGVGFADAHPTPRARLAVTIDEVQTILAQCDRLFVDRVGVENAVTAWPAKDPILAARTVVTWVSDPAFRTTNAAKLLGDALSKQKPPGNGTTHADVTRQRLASIERLGGLSAQ
jgi:hypothetical protein